MHYVIARRDKPGMADERARLQPAHAEYQADFMDRIVFGGAMVIDGTDLSGAVDIKHVIGNVIVMDVPDRATAQAFHDNDPYTKAGLFESASIERFWQRVP